MILAYSATVMFRFTIIVLFIEQAAAVVFGMLCTLALLSIPTDGPASVAVPPPAFPVLLRNYGWWLGLLPLCWALTMSRVGRSRDGEVLTQRIMHTGGMLLALLIAISTVSVWVSYLHLRSHDEYNRLHIHGSVIRRVERVPPFA